jgi:hypothetical protein
MANVAINIKVPDGATVDQVRGLFPQLRELFDGAGLLIDGVELSWPDVPAN